MPVRISVKASYGDDYIFRDASDIYWTPLRGNLPSWMENVATDMDTRNPPNFTTHSMEGTCNIAMKLLFEQPAHRMPYPELQILTALKQDCQAKCRYGDGFLDWFDSEGNRIDLEYSSSIGFLRDNNPVEWITEGDRWYGAVARCTNCGWMIPPSASSSIRPRLSAAVDLGFTTLSKVEPKPRWTRRGRRLRPGTDARSGFVELTRKGSQFIEAMLEGDFDQATALIRQQILNFRQESTQFPSPEQQTPQSVQNTLDSSLTEGYPIRDFAVFVADNGPLTKDEERIFQMLYGRSFTSSCEGCKLGEIGTCPLKSILRELDREPTEVGCRVNLATLVDVFRNREIEWIQYALPSRNIERRGYQKLVRIRDGQILGAMEWTWQLDKEGINQIRAFAKHAGAVEVEGGRRHTFTSILLTPDIANMEQIEAMPLPDPPSSGVRWAPSKFRLKCMDQVGDLE